MAQLLLAAIAVGVIAAAAATAVAYAGVAWWAPTQIPLESAMLPPSFPWPAALWALMAATCTTLVGAVIPALAAARLDVATALRD